MDRVQPEETKPHQLAPNLTEQINILQGNICVNFLEFIKGFASCYAENSLQFANKSVETFSCKN